jgi:hypothetical protein
VNAAEEIPAGAMTPAAKPPMREDLKLATVFGVAAGLAALALVPYMLQLMPEAFHQAEAKLHMPMSALLAVQSVQAVLLIGLMAFVGLRLGHVVGLGAPWLRALLGHQPRRAQPWMLAAVCGVAAALVVVGLDPMFAPYMPKPLQALPQASAQSHAFTGFLASFYGGIVEELELRLFFVTLLAWFLYLLSGRRVANWQRWSAVVVAAIAFGAGHLPAAAHVWPLDAVVVARTVLLNAIAGMVFGWFYVRNGIESAMLSHFCADLVLHVATPLLMG